MRLSLRGREPWHAPRVIMKPTLSFRSRRGGRGISSKSATDVRDSSSRESGFRMTAHHMSIVTIQRACERESEAISFKAATNVRYPSFSRNYLATGRDLSHHRADKDFNSIIHQMPTSKVAPFPAIVGKGGDGFKQ